MKEGTLFGISAEGLHRIFYREYGQPQKPTLIAVHGLTRNSSDFHFLGEYLQNDYHVFAPDVVGRGNSDRFINPVHYNFPQYLTDMSALIARTGAQELFWLGTSMGGLFGMMLAALPCKNHPIKALILNDVSPIIPKQALDNLEKYAKIKLVFQDLQEARVMLKEIYKPFGVTNEADWEYIIHNSIVRQEDGTYTLNYDPRAVAATGEEVRVSLPQIQKDPEGNLVFWDHWERIKCPILVIQGAQSDILTDDIIQAMKGRGPAFDHIVLDNVGHAPLFFEESRKRLIQEWLAQF